MSGAAVGLMLDIIAHLIMFFFGVPVPGTSAAGEPGLYVMDTAMWSIMSMTLGAGAVGGKKKR